MALELWHPFGIGGEKNGHFYNHLIPSGFLTVFSGTETMPMLVHGWYRDRRGGRRESFGRR